MDAQDLASDRNNFKVLYEQASNPLCVLLESFNMYWLDKWRSNQTKRTAKIHSNISFISTSTRRRTRWCSNGDQTAEEWMWQPTGTIKSMKLCNYTTGMYMAWLGYQRESRKWCKHTRWSIEKNTSRSRSGLILSCEYTNFIIINNSLLKRITLYKLGSLHWGKWYGGLKGN